MQQYQNFFDQFFFRSTYEKSPTTTTTTTTPIRTCIRRTFAIAISTARCRFGRTRWSHRRAWCWLVWTSFTIGTRIIWSICRCYDWTIADAFVIVITIETFDTKTSGTTSTIAILTVRIGARTLTLRATNFEFFVIVGTKRSGRRINGAFARIDAFTGIIFNVSVSTETTDLTSTLTPFGIRLSARRFAIATT